MSHFDLISSLLSHTMEKKVYFGLETSASKVSVIKLNFNQLLSKLGVNISALHILSEFLLCAWTKGSTLACGTVGL